MTSPKPLRLWPGVVAAVVLCVLRYAVPLVFSDAFVVGFLGAVVCAVAILVWWVFFSRAPWFERIGALVVIVVAFLVTKPLLHKSIATGMMGMMYPIYALPPVVAPVLVAWAALTRNFSDGVRRATMVVAMFLACGVWLFFRTDGIIGSGSQITWRWTPSAEERLLAKGEETSPEPATKPSVAAAPTSPEDGAAAGRNAESATVLPSPLPRAARAEWPGFRGPNRDSAIDGVRVNTDWTTSPPVQLWRRQVGPGWSSFAVTGDVLYTQEQRGESEEVAAYRVSTGRPIWRHRDPVRFWESNGGAGPRATPTINHNRVYTFGATGILNALDADTGARVWSRNVATDAEKTVPMWGFASSPLVIGDLVVVAASGRLAAYDAATGKRRWLGPPRPGSYSSPHLFTADGVQQILLLSAAGVTSVSPEDGALLWEQEWDGGGTTIVQPALTGDGDLLINAIATSGGLGLRRLNVTHGSNGWNVSERWTSTGLKPYFNDFVVHKGHAFGFDGNILACIDLSDGHRKWKGGRYGNGQLILLAAEDLLLVLSEDGELALVKATPDQFTEVARFKAIEGKTWNHPVLVRDTLLVRNGEEMAAFKLALDVR
ncbi:MAG TPA: PQQ-binding-like beta-propeller repeat protein [Vicinamibacterales bacterium]|jgi:outer membrane protein assembly factor BamB|nr:PQQ-binding-like beta-propeller repeat protein [Vicinamibacterales bacterium]